MPARLRVFNGMLALFLLGPAGATSLAATPEEQFEALQKRYKAEQEHVWADAEKTTSAEERLRLFRERDPANTMFPEFLKLEEQQRGTPLGLSILHHLVSLAFGGYGANPDFPVTEGGQKALMILTAHYADHPDLDLFFPWIRGGAVADDSKALLRRAMESPHRHVRGTALLALAEISAVEAQIPARFDANLALLADEPEKYAKEIEQYSRLRKQHWANVDPLASRGEALRLLNRVVEDFADVLEAPRTTYGPILLKVERTSEDGLAHKQRRPVSQLAESMRFELTHLSIGQPAPEIAGPDAFGKELKLSQQRGKVVVLMFSFKGCGPCEAMYPGNRALIETYHGRPFAFLGVMGDETLATVKEAVDEKKIAWPVWWDGGGTHGPLATRWNVTGWPEIYVLDHNGTIRYRELHGAVLAKAVSQLMAAAEQAR